MRIIDTATRKETGKLDLGVGLTGDLQLLLTGDLIGADEAMRIGFLNYVVATAQVLPQALEIAEKIAANGPIAVRQAKKAIHHGLQTDLRTGLAIEIECYNRTVVTEDRLEGVKAFGEKRKANFIGK